MIYVAGCLLQRQRYEEREDKIREEAKQEREERNRETKQEREERNREMKEERDRSFEAQQAAARQAREDHQAVSTSKIVSYCGVPLSYTYEPCCFVADDKFSVAGV
jgi:hypothetical protein